MEQYNIKAAKLTISRGCRENPKPWWNENLDKCIKARNDARQRAHLGETERELWVKLDKEARNQIQQAKREKWKNYVSTLNYHTDPNKVWQTIKGLDGRTTQLKPCKAMKHGNKLLITDREKANAFITEYSKVSRLPKDKENDKKIKHEVYNFCRAECDACNMTSNNKNICKQFHMEDLQRAKNNLSLRKAPGLYEISNEMIINLSDQADKELLCIINKSWKSSSCPALWKVGEIVPILKTYKNAEK